MNRQTISPSIEERDALFRAFQRRKFDMRKSVPEVSLSVTARLSGLEAARQRINGNRAGERITLTHLVIKATGKALAENPVFCSAYWRGAFYPAPEIRINLPVSEGRHVEYVVIGSPERKTVREIAAEVSREIAAIRAGQGSFCRELLAGRKMPGFIRSLAELDRNRYLATFNGIYGNFPLSNFGSFGIESGVGFISSPAVAALDFGRLSGGPDRAMKLTFAFDHRAADGAEAGAFLVRVKTLLEEELAAELG